MPIPNVNPIYQALKLRHRNSFLLLALAVLLITIPSASQAQRQSAEVSTWYQWYRGVHAYIGSIGGVLCQPGTILQFHTNGQITTDSPDKVCQVSLQGLSYPLPANSQVTEVHFPIRKHSAWPLSASRFGHLVEGQIKHDVTNLITHVHLP